MCRAVAGSLWIVFALACTSDDDAQPQVDAGQGAMAVPGTLPFGAQCTDSAQCEYLACIEVAAGRTVCSGGCTDDSHCPAGPNWQCLPAPQLGTGVRVCGCLSDSATEICGDGLDNDCDAVVDCPPRDAGVPDDASVDPDAGHCPLGGCEPAPASCATDPGLCPACTEDVDCDDGIACTEDRCQGRGCLHVPRNGACAAAEICDLRMGGCVPARACTSDADCVDDDACTRDEHCDLAAAMCGFVLLDGDGDEHYPAICGGEDCDDTDPTSHPGAFDVCDGADNDCNGSIDPPSAALLCGADRVCSAGTCACSVETVACGGRCLPSEQLLSDENNCGTCRNICGNSMGCEDGLCQDIDECTEDPDRCGDHGSCVNSVGSFSCQCDDGYDPGSGGCVDSDECALNTDGCDDSPDACVNSVGSFECDCPAGYDGDGLGGDGCLDVDECAANTDDCAALTEICVNTTGGHACSQGVLDVQAAVESTCAVLLDHRVKCWGGNVYGQLGVGDGSGRGTSPGDLGNNLPAVSLGTARTAVRVVGGFAHTCALLDNAAVKCWGNDSNGELGLDSTASLGDSPNELGDNLPAVSLGAGRSAQTIAAGWNHTCALLDDDSIKCWGHNGYGQLGLGDPDARSDAAGEMGDNLLPVALGSGRTAKAVDAGETHTCALLDNDAVKCWGANGSGQLGQGDTTTRGDGPGQLGDNLLSVALGTGRTATALAVGGRHTCVLLDNDTVKCWGDGVHGQLGLGTTIARGDDAGEMGDDLPPVDLGSGRTAKAITAGTNHTCAVLDDDSVKCWGYAGQGQLGQGDSEARGDESSEMGAFLPAVALGTGRTATSVDAGDSHTCALLDDGTIKCWGFNASGQLGIGDTEPRGDGAGEMGDALGAVNVGTL